MSVAYTIKIDKELAERLEEAAGKAKLSPADLIVECIEQQLEVAIRHRALMDRLDTVDQGLLELASFIGEATAGGGNVDLSTMCRYAPPKL